MSEHFLYIHGFNSSPASFKARTFVDWCRINAPAASVHVPELSHNPELAMAQLEGCFLGAEIDLILGSSLGGYYATWLSEKYNVPAVLINPAVKPWHCPGTDMIGPQTNYYSGRQYEITREHVDSLARFEVDVISRPELFLVLLQTGDEVLDYTLAAKKYRDSTQHTDVGGSHAYDGFEQKLPDILAWGRKAADGSLRKQADY